MEVDQRDLFDSNTDQIRREQQQFLEVARSVVRRVTPKEAGYAIGTGRTSLENALAVRDRKNPPTFVWTRHLVTVDPQRELLHFLAKAVNCEVIEAKDTRTDSEVIAETEAYLLRLGPIGQKIASDLRLGQRRR